MTAERVLTMLRSRLLLIQREADVTDQVFGRQLAECLEIVNDALLEEWQTSRGDLQSVIAAAARLNAAEKRIKTLEDAVKRLNDQVQAMIAPVTIRKAHA